jgi:hypothetical protein
MQADIKARKAAEEQQACHVAKQRAVDSCPAGKTPCRQNWANGDLCSAEYETADGVKVLASDLIDNVGGGWYYVDTAKVEEAQGREAAKAAAKQEQRRDAEQKKTDAIAEAKRTGKKQVLATAMVDCQDPSEECSQDAQTTWIDGDGKITTTYQHTW